MSLHYSQKNIRKVWKYQRVNQKTYIKEGQTKEQLKEKGQTMIYKTLNRKLKIEQHEPHLKAGLKQVPAPLVASVILLFKSLMKGLACDGT